MNGFELCKRIKSENPATGILMLTTLGTTADKLTGFDAGADDYLTKPFEFDELIARVKALARRSTTSASGSQSVLRFEDLKLDLEKKTAQRKDRVIRLSAREFRLLEYFMRNPQRVISRAELAENIWNLKFETGTNVVEVYINMLRNKIDRDFPDKLLHTRINLGYVLSRDE
jgi:two-component system copper resistance phosphate regulon response regulator CusR